MHTVVILDFDRVLFDTDAFSERLEEEGLSDIPRGEELMGAIEERGIDLKEFVNQDAVSYLESTNDHTIVVTSYHSRHRGDNDEDSIAAEWFQREKVMRSGLGHLVKELHVTGEHKQEKMLEIKDRFKESLIVVVDDETENIVDAKECGFETVWFRTPKNLMSTGPEGVPLHIESEQAASFKAFLERLEKYKESH